MFHSGRDRYPVLILEIKPPSAFGSASKRREADEQLRQWFLLLHDHIEIPRLYGISAFGTRAALYQYISATGAVSTQDPNTLR
jgi:hypothetical protein